MFTKRAIIVASALLLGIGVVFTTPAAAQQKFNFRAALYFKKDHPWYKGLSYFARKVSEYSKGAIKIDIFGSGVLGSEAQTLHLVKDGSLDFVVADPSAGSTFAKELDFFVLPFLFRDYAHWQHALDGTPGKSYASLIERKTGLKILGYWGGSPRNVLSTKKPVMSIADMKGFRLRVLASPLKIAVWKAVGAVPTPIAYMETYLAMKEGVVDGMENESVAVLAMKFYEVAPFIARTEHEFTVRPLFMSEKSYAKLPAHLQQIVLKAAREATVFERKAEVKANKSADELMASKFHVKFNAIDKKPFQVAAKPVIAKFAKSMGLSDLFTAIEQTR